MAEEEGEDDEAGVAANADEEQEEGEDSDPEVEVPFDFEDVPVAGEKTEEQLRKEAKSGARSNLLQANMPLSLWPYASKHHAMAINIVKQLNGGDPPWTLRFDNGFLGRQLPFGRLLFFWEGKYEPKRGKFAPNAKRGVFLGYNIQAEHVWRGEYLVANVDILDYFLKEGHLKTIRTKRVALPNGDFIFPLHYKEKPVLDLQELDYQPEEDDEDDPPDGDDQDGDDPGPDQSDIREEEPADVPGSPSGAPELEAEVSEMKPEELASLKAEPMEKKGKEKKEREPTLFELYYDPSVNPYMLPDGKPVPKGYVYDGVRLVREKKGSKRVPGFPTDLWQNLSHKQRKKAWNDYQQELEEKKKAAEAIDKASIEGSPSETPPAMVAAPAMPVEYNVYEPHRSGRATASGR